MGNRCFKGTPHKVYSGYLTPADPIALKESWPLIKIFKLKKLFETKSLQSKECSHRYLDFKVFTEMFPEFNQQKLNAYTQIQRMRLFELFDWQGEGRLSWPDFFTGLTLCYYGSLQNLAALLFALYDQKLQLVLSKAQAQHLLESNSRYLAEKGEEGSEDGIELKFKEIGIEQWMKQSIQWIDYDKFRKLFGVFVQEQLQKQLGQNFSELNDLYNTSKSKYVGYLVNRKWFQSWRIFLQKEYDIELSGYAKFQTYTRTNKTIKTLRTKKTIKSLKSSRTINSGNSKKKITEIPKLKHLHLPPDLKISSSNFNLIHANIGDRPTEIRNNTLEGEFSQILAPGLIENVDYVILSEEVWGKLKLIYGAYPEFRRSGDTVIEIYPKTVKIYLQVHQGLIDYERQKICQFSSMMEFKLLLQKALGFQEEQDKKQLEDYTFFIKHMNLRQWQVIEDLSCKVAELTAELLVFLAVVPNKDVQLFKRRYGHPTADASHLHIGDECLYYQGDSGQAKRAVVVSQTKSKLVLHFKGSSYINDLCIDREILRNRVGVIKEDNVKKVRIEEGKLCGIPDGRGFDFINSVLLVLLSNESIAKSLEQISQSSGSPSSLMQQLALIYKMLTCGSPPKTLIAEFIRLYFPNYLHFQLTMAEEFLMGLFSKLNYNFSKFGNPVIGQYKLQSEIAGYCNCCRRRNVKSQDYFVLTVPVAEEEVLYYEVIYVPFGYTINYTEQIRVAFSLSKKATFQQYKKAFEKAAELKGVAYILVEIQGHDIIKNYLNAYPEATLQQLLLREEDKIYAYELCVKLDNFIADHYTTDPTIKPRSLKEDQLIDFLKKNTVLADVTGKRLKGEEEEERVWNFGKIKHIQNERYTHKLSLRIEYREKRGQILQIQINPESQGVAPFPTQSYRFAQQFHIRCIQRVYNQVSNEMQLVNQPFVLMVASWMRLREIQLLVYQQIKDQIELHGRFRIDQPQSSKMGKKQRIKKFKQYLIKHKPYSIKFTDQEGRCAICYKLQKSKVFGNEQEFACEGNEDINPEDPIFWIIKPYQIRICIDWKSPFDFCMPEPVEHGSAVQVQHARNQSLQHLNSCLEERFKQGQPQKCMFCRQEEGIPTWQQSITNFPERIAILLDRVSEESTKVNKKLVSFEMDDMTIGCMVYQLTAIIALNNSRSVHQYLVYLRDKARWLQYEGELVRVAKKGMVQKVCALALFYSRVGSRQKVQKK